MPANLYEDPEDLRRAVEFKMRRMLAEEGKPPPSPNLVAFEKARAEAEDWHGTCPRCGTSRTGTLAQMKLPCGNCGAT